MVKSKAAAVSVRVPQTRDQAAKMIAEFGEASREVELIALTLKETIAKAKEKAAADAAIHEAKADELFAGIKLYCEVNRESLLNETGLKSHDFGTGKVAWRLKPSKVSIRGEELDVIDRIREKEAAAVARGETGENYRNFLRFSIEINREGMLHAPDLARTIEGVSVGRSGEVFEVEAYSAADQLAEAV